MPAPVGAIHHARNRIEMGIVAQHREGVLAGKSGDPYVIIGGWVP